MSTTLLKMGAANKKSLENTVLATYISHITKCPVIEKGWVDLMSLLKFQVLAIAPLQHQLADEDTNSGYIR